MQYNTMQYRIRGDTIIALPRVRVCAHYSWTFPARRRGRKSEVTDTMIGTVVVQ